MKRLAVFALTLLLWAAFFACADARQPVPSPSPTQEAASDVIAIVTPAVTDAPTPAPVPESTPEPTEEPAEEPTPEPKAYIAEGEVYAIAWMSDPQHYSELFPEKYYAMTSFLRDHREELHLAYIINTGDLVNDADDPEQWDVADRAQSMIEEIPNGVLAGNHDVPIGIGYTEFCKRFGEDRYAGRPWYGGSYRNNRGHYDLVTIGRTDYLFVYMGFDPDDEAVEWVRNIFGLYPERVGVLCLHDYYTKSLTLSQDGKRWHDEVVKKSPNLYMVLCGHKYGSYVFPESFDDDRDGKPDRTVYQMLFNYQATKHDGGDGYLRLIQINEADGTMRNLTYSPYLDDFNRFDDPENREPYYEFDERNEEFTLPIPWMIEN
jgi:hypothetical protein